jgi:hypothetical protein
MGTVTLTSPQAAMRLDRIREVLRSQQLTAAQLAAEIHISKRWVHPYIAHLHAAGEIHVCRWKVHSGGGDLSAVFTGGPGRDAVRPPARDEATKAREYRARVNADPDRRDAYLAKKRAKAWQPKRDPLAAWIPVRAT